MGIGVSLFLIAVGAILAFAVSTTISGVSLVAIGIILMCVGGVGLVITLVMMAPRRRTYPPRDEIVEEERVYRDRAPYDRTRPTYDRDRTTY